MFPNLHSQVGSSRRCSRAGVSSAGFGPHKRHLLLGIALLGCWWTQEIFGAEEEKALTALYVSSKIVIDGNLDEAEWRLAQPATDFTQNEPREGEPATERTEVRLLYDEENLYIGVYCFDSAGEKGLVVTDLRRDYTPLQGDHFSVLLDTFDDNRNAFVFGTNPRGGVREGQMGGDGQASNFDWDAVWYVKSKITELGWQAEMAIPFKSLRFRDNERQVWGVNFMRRNRRKNEDIYWAPIPRPYRLSRVSLAGELEGMSGIRQGRNLYVKPYLLAPVLRREGDDIDFLPDAGFDLKYGVTSGLTLDLSVNTDFAQVEADQQQINLTRFSLFFPEKREFFLENASIFEFSGTGRGFRSSRDLIPFFSRRIGISSGDLIPILGGLRLSGTAGKYRVGLLSMQTDEFKDTPTTNFSVARVRRDIFLNSDIGAILVNKQVSGGEFNRTYGLDTNLRFFRYLDISSFLLKTATAGEQGKDAAGKFRISWNDRMFDIQAEHLSIQEEFNPEVGFVPRQGIRKSTGEFTVRPRPGERIPWIREFRPSLSIEYLTNQENLLETRSTTQNISISFEDSSSMWFTRRESFERLDEEFEIRDDQFIAVGDYQTTEYVVSYNSDRSRLFRGNVTLRTTEFWDGNKDSFQAGLGFQPGYQFGAEISWSYADISLPSGNFTTDLVTTRLRYSFSPIMFLNALIQYNSTRQEVASNLRFNFTYKPLSDFFLVYNERRSTTGEVTERALIGKLTYVFDF
ncbi:MAG: DUF5916 domain-containing protein [Acidobacteria bacterium]|nr:DUF5916 domain-containing protein [Acidobacteriota bacterium]